MLQSRRRADPDRPTPPVVDLDTWLDARRALLDREKAHTREGDAIHAAYRRLPMVEVDANVFEGREQLIATPTCGTAAGASRAS